MASTDIVRLPKTGDAELDGGPMPWERQKGESRQAFQAFAIYRDMQPKRSIRTVAAQLDKSTSLIARWSSKWFWQLRCRAWDEQVDEKRRLAQIELIEKMAERHASTVGMALSVLTLPVREAVKRFQEDPQLLEMMELEDVVKLAILCSRNIPTLIQSERLARGAPTDISEVTHQGGDKPMKIQIDWADEWRMD